MNKESYINSLKTKLNGLPQEDINDAVRYCEEYFDEAGEENFEKAAEELGSPTKFANMIKADLAYKNINKESDEPVTRKQSKSNAKNVWLIILGILSLPISLPLLLTAVLLMFTAVLLIAVFIFVGVILAVASVSIFILGISSLVTSPATGLTVIALALVAIGLGLMLAYFGWWAFIRLTPWVGKKFGQLFQKRKGEQI